MALRLALFYAAVFGFVGISLPFWPVWLTAKGLGAAEIGLLITAGTWVRIVVPPMVAHIADRRGERKRVVVVLAALAFVVHLLFLAADGFAGLLAVSILAAIAFTPIIPMGENLSLLLAREGRIDYGRVRLWGSIAFIAGAVGGGRILGEAGPPAILTMVLATLALVALAAFALPDTRPPPARRRMPIAALLASRTMLVFLAAASLIQASHAAYYGFATLSWRQAGIDDQVIGLLWAEGVLAEIILFALGGGLAARLGPAKLLSIGAAAGIIRWTILALEPGLGVLVLAQALHAFTFGAAHLGAMVFLARMVAPEHSASAQALYAGVAMGLVMGGATILSGTLFEAFGTVAFWAMAALSAAGGLGALALAALMPAGYPRPGSRV